MRVVVFTSEPVTARQLRDALSGEIEPHDAEVVVVAPALHESALKFWLSDADEAIAKADAVRRETVAKLRDAGVAATGETGDSDPLQAIDDALAACDADRIVLFTRHGADKLYREDVDVAEVAKRYGVPVDYAILSDSSA